ncbi:hypothetical protein SLA2020_024960 [Shorea laevis]
MVVETYHQRNKRKGQGERKFVLCENDGGVTRGTRIDNVEVMKWKWLVTDWILSWHEDNEMTQNLKRRMGGVLS